MSAYVVFVYHCDRCDQEVTVDRRKRDPDWPFFYDVEISEFRADGDDRALVNEKKFVCSDCVREIRAVIAQVKTRK